jgi:hypothetical protein
MVSIGRGSDGSLTVVDAATGTVDASLAMVVWAG